MLMQPRPTAPTSRRPKRRRFMISSLYLSTNSPAGFYHPRGGTVAGQVCGAIARLDRRGRSGVDSDSGRSLVCAPRGRSATIMDAIDLLLGRVSPAQLAEPGPSAAQLETILAAAARAPDHGKMQPWRFLLIEGGARERFGEVMAQSLKRREPEAPAGKLDAERKKALRAPLVVVVAAAVKENPKVPEVEQIVAAGAA